jgi:hypothetical protein
LPQVNTLLVRQKFTDIFVNSFDAKPAFAPMDVIVIITCQVKVVAIIKDGYPKQIRVVSGLSHYGLTG